MRPDRGSPASPLIASAYLDAAEDLSAKKSLRRVSGGFQECQDAGDGGNLGAQARRCSSSSSAALGGRRPEALARARHQPSAASAKPSWKDLFESRQPGGSHPGADPAGAYSRMDFESRERYRKRHRPACAQHPARPNTKSPRPPWCWRNAPPRSDGSRRARRQPCRLLPDRSRAAGTAQASIGYRAPFASPPARLIRRIPRLLPGRHRTADVRHRLADS